MASTARPTAATYNSIIASLADVFVDHGILVLHPGDVETVVDTDAGTQVLEMITAAGFDLQYSSQEVVRQARDVEYQAAQLADAVAKGQRIDTQHLGGATRRLEEAAVKRQSAADRLVLLTHLATRMVADITDTVGE